MQNNNVNKPNKLSFTFSELGVGHNEDLKLLFPSKSDHDQELNDAQREASETMITSVSYTHLTLPTIYSV